MLPKQPGHLDRRALEVIDEVCDADPEARSALIDELCADDEQLRERVVLLLDFEDQGVLRAAAPGAGAHALAASLAGDAHEAPQRIGQYRVIRQVGRGGMGVVYEAEQESPRRRVALKVLRSPFVGRDTLRRFHREAHVLGRLQHPGIAQIYEAGVADTPNGRSPFFAMEFIDGLLLDEHAEHLTRRQRLELLARVCDAVEYANQIGVIHRDLKPGNVLVDVGASDPVGQPKVLDFGIARVADPELQITTIQTEAGQLIGTLSYMSPEQVAGDPDHLDARCDVYALGAIGYRLLTGRPALDIGGLPVAEAARVIRDDDPTPLTMHDKSLSGDVATIIATAMDKDPDRRYASAGEFAADIRRHLADVPIIARPASTFYQLTKFARRNRGFVLGVAIAFGVLILGVAGSSIALVHALHSNADLDQALKELSQSHDDLKRVTELQAGVNLQGIAVRMRAEMLAALEPADRAVVEERTATVNFVAVALDILEHEFFERWINMIDARFANAPEIQAPLLQAMVTRLIRFGLIDAADRPQREAYEIRRGAFGEDHPDTIESIEARAALAMARRDFAAAEADHRTVLTWRREHLGETHPETIRAMNQVALSRLHSGDHEQSERTIRASLQLAQRHLGDDHPVTLETLGLVGAVVLAQDRQSEAEPFIRTCYERSLELHGPAHRSTLSAMKDLCVVIAKLGRLSEAETLTRRLLEIRRHSQGDDHHETQFAMMHLAGVLRAQGRFDDAGSLLQSVLDRRALAFGTMHPSTLNVKYELGNLLRQQDRAGEAEPHLREAYERQRRILGEGHPATQASGRAFADTLDMLGRHDEASSVRLALIPDGS